MKSFVLFLMASAALSCAADLSSTSEARLRRTTFASIELLDWSETTWPLTVGFRDEGWSLAGFTSVGWRTRGEEWLREVARAHARALIRLDQKRTEIKFREPSVTRTRQLAILGQVEAELRAQLVDLPARLSQMIAHAHRLRRESRRQEQRLSSWLESETDPPALLTANWDLVLSSIADEMSASSTFLDPNFCWKRLLR